MPRVTRRWMVGVVVPFRIYLGGRIFLRLNSARGQCNSMDRVWYKRERFLFSAGGSSSGFSDAPNLQNEGLVW